MLVYTTYPQIFKFKKTIWKLYSYKLSKFLDVRGLL